MDISKMDLPVSSDTIRVIHGEDELFDMVKTVDELALWAESNKILVFYFVVDIDRAPSFVNVKTDYVSKPLYIGNHSYIDRLRLIEKCLKSWLIWPPVVWNTDLLGIKVVNT